MDLKEYVIPVAGLKYGVHHFEFDVDWVFFQQFENSPVEQGRFHVDIDLDKQHDHWVVEFTVGGELDTECDRCLAPIALPVDGTHLLIVRYHDERGEDEEQEADVIYISKELHKWNVSQLIYEFVLLSIPARKVYDCEEDENPPCDLKALELLEEGEADTSDSPDNNPFRDVLKNIELKN